MIFAEISFREPRFHLVNLLNLKDCFIQEHIIRTGCGSVSVTVYGNQEKPPLITYPDLALNRKQLYIFYCNIVFF